MHISWDTEYKIIEARRILEIALQFQPTIDLNFPDQRRVNNPFCRCNTCHLPELQQAQGLNQLADGVSPSRFNAWNFQTLKNHETIEYRQPTWQATSKGTKEWVGFVISFIHATLAVASTHGWNALIRIADN